MCLAPAAASVKIVAQNPAGSWSPAVSHARWVVPPATRPACAAKGDAATTISTKILFIIALTEWEETARLLTD